MTLTVPSTHDQIVNTAAQLVWVRGYHGTSVDDIIREARVSKGSFYHHFGSKEALAAAVVDRWTEQLSGAVRARLSDKADPEQNLHAILDAFVGSQVDTNFAGCPLGRLALEMGDVSDALRDRLQSGFDTMRNFFTHYLREAGMTEAEATEHGRYMLATVEGALMLDKVRGGGAVLEDLIAAIKLDVSRRLVEVAC